MDFMVLTYGHFATKSFLDIYQNNVRIKSLHLPTSINIIIDFLPQIAEKYKTYALVVVGPDFIKQELTNRLPTEITVKGV